MERSKGIILLVVGLAAVLIVWKVGFNSSEQPKPPVTEPSSEVSSQPNQQITGQQNQEQRGVQPQNQQGNSRMRGGNRGRQQMDSTTNTPPEIAMKISIPKDISSAELQTLYQEYTSIAWRSLNSGRSGRSGRNRGGMDTGMMGGGFGGMMGGGDFGGMMGGGGPGGMMGGGMMGGGGFGGGMGGMMGGGDPGAMMGGAVPDAGAQNVNNTQPADSNQG